MEYKVPVAKWLRRPPSKRKIVGSAPTGNIYIFVALSNRQRKGLHVRNTPGTNEPERDRHPHATPCTLGRVV